MKKLFIFVKNFLDNMDIILINLAVNNSLLFLHEYVRIKLKIFEVGRG